MEVNIKSINGSWDHGYALHKHTIESVYLGDNEWGHATFDTTRSEPGEALYQLKYRNDWDQVEPLAKQLQISLLPMFDEIGLIIPMPASTARTKQPVDELAKSLGRLTKIPVFNRIVIKTPPPSGSTPLKNLKNRTEKDEALAGLISINDCIKGAGYWNALVLDDIFDTGATMHAVCQALRGYPKINKIYTATITWK